MVKASYLQQAILVIAFTLTGLAGCLPKTQHLTLAQQTQKMNEFVATGGYASDENHRIKSTREIWLHDSVLLDTTLVMPEDSGRYPVIIYLPGLGEDANAGAIWRQQWAQAGYAVFTVQPMSVATALKGLDALPQQANFNKEEEDNDLSRLQNLRYSDLHYVGRAYFSNADLIKRLAHLAFAVNELKQRAQQPTSVYAALDLNNLVIAGYELGAQTATALLEQNPAITIPTALSAIKPKATVLLSPVVDLAAGDVSHRFQKLSSPMLAITGPNDTDDYGVSIPELRTTIWEYAPSGNKYLLMLDEAEHTLFSGSHFEARHSSEQPKGARPPGPDGAEPPGLTELQSMHFNIGVSAGAGPMGFGNMAPPGINPRHDSAATVHAYKTIAIIRSVTTAFLDSLVKAKTNAKQWVNSSDFQLWSGKRAELKIK